MIVGRRTFDVGLGPWGDTPFPAPTFVITHEKREPLAMQSGTFTFVTDGIESALRHARSAAAARDILVMGADVAQQYLKAGLVDEIIIQLVPILMGAGTRLFDRTGGPGDRTHPDQDDPVPVRHPSELQVAIRARRRPVACVPDSQGPRLSTGNSVTIEGPSLSLFIPAANEDVASTLDAAR